MTRTSFGVSDEGAARELLEESFASSCWEDLEGLVASGTPPPPPQHQHQQQRRGLHQHQLNQQQQHGSSAGAVEGLHLVVDDEDPRSRTTVSSPVSSSGGNLSVGGGSVGSASLNTHRHRAAGEPFDVTLEARQLFHVALPSVLIQFSLFFVFPMSASVVGRSEGTTALGGFSLGSLIGNLTCLSIMEGALTAGDTLMPRAYGNRRYGEVAMLAVRSFFVVTLLLVPPVLPLCWYSERILVALGQDADASAMAQEWIRLYFLGVPANLAFRVAMRFLLAQHLPWPLVYSSVVPALLIHPLLLRLLVPKMGLPGSALAITLTQWCMALALFGGYFYRNRKCPTWKVETWPGLSTRLVRDALRPEPLLKFFSLSLGGVLSLSEWWFWYAFYLR